MIDPVRPRPPRSGTAAAKETFRNLAGLALGGAMILLLGAADDPKAPAPVPLQSAASFGRIADPDARSIALFQEMGKVLLHPRCVNCHPRTDSPRQGDRRVVHNPPVTRGPDGHGGAGLKCAACHGPSNFALANKRSIPGNPAWHLAPVSMAWEGRTLGAICLQIKDMRRNGGKTLADLSVHNGTDKLVGWGWHPGAGRAPAPGTQAEFGALTRAWVETGAKCPAP